MNFEVVNLKRFARLASPLSLLREKTRKPLGFDGKWVTSFSSLGFELRELLRFRGLNDVLKGLNDWY